MEADVILLDNLQFVYELSLAELELLAMGADFEFQHGFRQLKILNKSDGLMERVRKRGSYYKIVDGKLTDYFKIIQANITRSANQYLTHWIYPYKGKFHPQMVRSLMNIIGLKEGDVVLDPFSGSGTTAVESQLLGINFIGIDISPLCVIQGKVKTESVYVIDEIEKLRDDVISVVLSNSYKGFDDYYKFLTSLSKDDRVQNFYILARLLAVSDNSRRKREFSASFIKNVDLMVKSVKTYSVIQKELGLRLGSVNIQVGDSRNLKLPDNSVDGVITSPPYSIALDYVKNDIHALKDLGCNISLVKEMMIGVRGSSKDRISVYNEDMKCSYKEMYRVLKPGKNVVIVVGNATHQGKEVQTVEFTIEYMESIGFKLLYKLNKVIFGLYNVMKNESILIFRKH